MSKTCESLCKHCDNLQVWPGMFVPCRFLCFKRKGKVKAFGKYGRDTRKGFPPVSRCSEFKEGQHYSVLTYLLTTLRKKGLIRGCYDIS